MGWAPITLGAHEYELVPQRLARLERHLNDISGLLSLNISGQNIVGSLGDQAYTLLKVFIPDLMPEWEWRGFTSAEDFERFKSDGEDRRSDDAIDNSPSFTEIVTAFDAVMKVNRVDLFKSLGKLVGEDFLRAMVKKAIADSMLGSSETSSQASTESSPTTSGMTGLTAAA